MNGTDYYGLSDLAPLHPTHATEATPIGTALDVELIAARVKAKREGRCTTCGATGKQRCREGGRFVGRHPGRSA